MSADGVRGPPMVRLLLEGNSSMALAGEHDKECTTPRDTGVR